MKKNPRKSNVSRGSEISSGSEAVFKFDSKLIGKKGHEIIRERERGFDGFVNVDTSGDFNLAFR